MFSNTHEICYVCLCTDRRLYLLGSYRDTFVRICNAQPWNQNGEPMLCWECVSLLRKVQKFQEKALRSQNLLEVHDKNEIHPNLSTLMIIEKNDYDYVMTHDDDNDNNCDVKLEEEEKKVPKYNIDDIKNENHYDFDDYEYDYEHVDNENVKTENIEVSNNKINTRLSKKRKNDTEPKIKTKLTKKKTKAKFKNIKFLNSVPEESGVSKKPRICKNPYKIITLEGGLSIPDKKWYRKIRIDDIELKKWIEKEREALRKSLFKCDRCVTNFLNPRSYTQHMETFHDEAAGSNECDICGRRFHSKEKMSRHLQLHYFKYLCLVCNEEHYKRKEHICKAKQSDKLYECLKCGRRYDVLKDFFRHYKLHTVFMCDHCGKVTSTKNSLKSHMRHTHLPIQCTICQITYKQYRFLIRHNKEKHVVQATEDAYCVECDVQFDNKELYKRHLKTSVKHNRKPIKKHACKECGKLFNKASTANYHYNYFHLKQTKFICEPCDRYFLNGYQLRFHRERVHENKRPPKNKFCSYCGRAFSNNRVLENHVRTHTGERPFKCERCPAAFTQQQALKSHTRAIHKDRNK